MSAKKRLRYKGPVPAKRKVLKRMADSRLRNDFDGNEKMFWKEVK